MLNWDDEELVYLSFAKFLYQVKMGNYLGGTTFVSVRIENMLELTMTGEIIEDTSSCGSNEDILWFT